MNKVIIFLCGLILFSCHGQPKKTRPEEANMVCNDFYALGQIEYDTYTFCSIVPVEVEYHYKKGFWKFWDLNGQLVAEGTFNVEKGRVEDHGGCPYEYLTGKIKTANWRFWDENSVETEPEVELIKNLQSCEVSLLEIKNNSVFDAEK